MATDPWFIIELSVNMYFEFFKTFFPLVTECSTQMMAAKDSQQFTKEL